MVCELLHRARDASLTATVLYASTTPPRTYLGDWQRSVSLVKENQPPTGKSLPMAQGFMTLRSSRHPSRLESSPQLFPPFWSHPNFLQTCSVERCSGCESQLPRLMDQGLGDYPRVSLLCVTALFRHLRLFPTPLWCANGSGRPLLVQIEDGKMCRCFENVPGL